MEEERIKQLKKIIKEVSWQYFGLRNIDDSVQLLIFLIQETELRLSKIDISKINQTLLDSLEVEIEKLKEIIKKEEGKTCLKGREK